MNKQVPFIKKDVFPGGVTDLIDRKPKGVQRSGVTLDKSKNIDLGDIISFEYIGRELLDGDTKGAVLNSNPADRVILNPLIVFAGYDTGTQCVMGVDMKRFTLEKQSAAMTTFLVLLRRFYYYQDDTDKLKIWRKRTFQEVPYTGSLAFKYDNFGGSYGAVGKHLLRYFKSYKPKLMRNMVIMPPDIAEMEAKSTVKTLPKKS